MKKIQFLICVMLSFVWTAVSYAELPANGTKGYFYNAATGKFLSHGVTTVSNSGAKVDLYGVPLEIKNEGSSVGEFSDATYNYIRFQMGDYYGRYLRIVSNGLDCAGSSYHKWAVTEVSTGHFVIRCIYKPSQVAYATQGYYVAINANDELVLVDGIDNAAVWEFLTPAQQQLIVTNAANARLSTVASAAGITASNVSELETALAGMASMDKTDVIDNPTMFSNTTGWSVNNIQGTAISNGSYRIQNAAGGQSMTTQTVTGLTPGLYKVEVQAFYRASVLARCQTYGNDGYVFSNAYIKANNNQVLIKDWYEISTDSHSKPTSRGQISSDFDTNTKYTNTVYTFVGSDGNLELTIAVPSYSAGDYPNWICFNNVRLTYYYNAEDLSTYETMLSAAVSAANAVSPLPSQAAADLASIVSVNNQSYSTSAAYQTAINAIEAATLEAQTVSTAYVTYQKFKATFEDIRDQNVYTDTDNAVATFNNSDSNVDAAIQAAALTDAVSTIATQQATLHTAMTTLISSVKINDGELFDLTSLMVNPAVAPSSSTSADGWTTTANLDFGNYQITQLSTSVPFDMHQVIANMPAGQYTVKVRGFFRPGGFSSTDMTTVANTEVPTRIYLNETEQALLNICADGSPTQLSKGASTKVNGTIIYIPNSRSHLEPFFNANYYWNEMPAVIADDCDLTIGLKYDTFTSGGWGVISDFQLYYGGPLDLSAWQAQLALVVSEAQALEIPTAPRRLLYDVIGQYNKTYTTAEAYQDAIAQINAAKAVAEPYVDPYAAYKTMRQMIQDRITSQTSVFTDPNDATESYSSALSTINTAVENVNSVEALETQKANLWNAALTFMKDVEINDGMGFDLTWMIQDADFSDSNYKAYWTEDLASSTTVGVTNGIMRYYNSSFDLHQQLPYTLPAGAYRMKVDGFERTNDPMNTAWEDYQNGSSVVTGTLYLNSNEQLITNLFDVQTVTSSTLGGAQPDGASFYVPNGSSAANQYLQGGYYPNTMVGVLADDALVTIGYRCANATAWTAVDNFQLEYIGDVPEVAINVTANELVPVVAPFTLNVSDAAIDELYAIASETENKVLIYPVNSIKAGTPCVAKFNTSTYSAPMEMTLASGKKFIMPWEGGYMTVDAPNYTWNYFFLGEGSTTGANMEKVVLDFSDPNEFNFKVDLENFAARRYLSKVEYIDANDESRVAEFNVAPPTRRDIPNAVMLPLPAFDADQGIVEVRDNDTEEIVATVTVLRGESEAYVYNLLPQHQYKYRIDGNEVGKFETVGRLRMVYAPSAYNIRDLGGWETQDRTRINYGHIFRGSTLNGYVNCTPEDIQALKDLGIGGEIDLRWKESYDKDMGCGTSAFGFTGDDYYFAAANDYTAANLNESGTQGRLKQEFDFILDHFRQGKAVYFHCAWGADRTGMLSFLLEGVLGATLDQIYKNYELTSFSAAPGATNRLKTSFQDRIDVIQALPGTTLRDKFEYYFVNSLGVPLADITYFRSVMLDRYPLKVDENVSLEGYNNGRADITLHRTLKANMHNTIVLPCDLTLWESEYFFGKGTKIEIITGYEDGVLKTQELTDDDDIAPANTPFLLIPASVDENNTYNLHDVPVREGELQEATFTGGKLVGSYAASTVIKKSETAGKENYVISNDQFYRVNATSATMKGTRAYLVLDTPSSGVKSVVSFGDGGADGINIINNDEDVSPVIYDLSGRRVKNPARGLYIINGKKQFVY